MDLQNVEREDISEMAEVANMERIMGSFTIEGVIKRIKPFSEGAGHKGQRMWWTVELEYGITLLVKMWNWEVDTGKNQRWFSSGPSTNLGKLPDDIKHNLKSARFRIVNAYEFDHAQKDERITLQMELVKNEQ